MPISKSPVTHAGKVDAAYVARSVDAAFAFRRQVGAEGRLDVGAQAAYRAVNQEGDGLAGLAVDVYANYALIHLYSESRLPFIDALTESLLRQAEIRGVYLTDRTRSGDKAAENRFLAGERAANDQVEITENGLVAAIHLATGPATGLYLDQRDNRMRLAALLSPGDSFLNTFAYSCSFSMFAARAGAKTLSLDLAKGGLETGKKNFARNGLSLEGHRFIADDVFLVLPRLQKRGETFNAVLLDPPTFARGKAGQFTTEKDYGKLVSLAAPLVAPNGILLAFANTHRLTEREWLEQVNAALGASGKRFEKFGTWPQAPDFRVSPDDEGGMYLKGAAFRRTDG